MDLNKLYETLKGEWKGIGRGEYPTIETFEYEETLRFESFDDRQVIHYEQYTKRKKGGNGEVVPSHWEHGYIRILADGSVEVNNAQSGGRNEVLVGSAELTRSGLTINLQSNLFSNEPKLTRTSRLMEISGAALHYTMHMTTMDVPEHSLHLDATLKRIVP